MLRIGLALIIAAVAWTGPASAAILSPGTIVFGGHTRTYLIEVPPGNGPKPLVIALHGKGGTGGVHTVYQVPPPAPLLWDFFKVHSL